MTPETRRVYHRATIGLEFESADERRAVWTGLCQLIGEEEELGRLARASKLCVENEIRLQADFLEVLQSPPAKG